MSISVILNSTVSPYQLGSNTNPYQKQIQQLSQDLTSGNLSAVRSDFATLQKAFSQPATSSSSASAASTPNPIAQAFNQLATDLKSGNLNGAQQDFFAIQSQGSPSTPHVHHYHPPKTGTEDSTTQNSLLKDLSQLGRSVASGNLAAAQKAYAALQAQASVSTVSSLHQTSPPVFPPALGRPVVDIGQMESPILGAPVSLVA
jgi:hypothetical protein